MNPMRPNNGILPTGMSRYNTFTVQCLHYFCPDQYRNKKVNIATEVCEHSSLRPGFLWLAARSCFVRRVLNRRSEGELK